MRASQHLKLQLERTYKREWKELVPKTRKKGHSKLHKIEALGVEDRNIRLYICKRCNNIVRKIA